MDAVTYPDGNVQSLLTEQFVAFKPDVSQATDLAKKFGVGWTPGILFLDESETVHYRAYGYHPPDEFRALLGVARGSAAFNRGEFKQAVSILGQTAEEGAGTSFVPEALYWLGVSHYKSGDKDSLMKAWNRLIDQHGASLWAKKVSFIRG